MSSENYQFWSARHRYYLGLAASTLLIFLLAVAIVPRVNEESVDPAVRYERLFSKAKTLADQGRITEAVETYRSALAVLPADRKSAGGYNNLGWALQGLGRLDEAIDAYQRAIELDPELSVARNNLAAAIKIGPR